LAKIPYTLKLLGFLGISANPERMIGWMILALRLVLDGLKFRRKLLLENLALRHQLLVLSRRSGRIRLTPLDRALWAWLSQTWPGWKTRLCLDRVGSRQIGRSRRSVISACFPT
jgi:hypothetical protein